MAALPEKLVHLVLMDDVLQPAHRRSRHPFGFVAHLAAQNLIDVDSLLYGFAHDNFDFQIAKITNYLESKYFFQKKMKKLVACRTFVGRFRHFAQSFLPAKDNCTK